MGWNEVKLFAEAAISIFAIVNPVGGLPMFASLTEDASPRERRRVLRLGGVVAMGVIVVMALAGQFLLQGFFHIGIQEFAFGGGLLLIVTGIRGILDTAHSHQGAAQLDREKVEMEQMSLAVSPIAVPLLAGPGSVVTVMLMVNQHGRLYALGACLVAFVFVVAVMNYADLAYRLMGRLGAMAVGRVMHIFIVAIGVKFCFQALRAMIPALGQ